MPTEVPTPAQVRRTSLVISTGTWLVTGAVVIVSMSTAAPFIAHHSPGWGTGPVMALAADGCFILSLQADSTLARYGVSGGRWPAAFRWVTGLATVWLNIGASALAKDVVGVVVHLIPPLLLLLVAEAGPAYRRALAHLTQTAARQAAEPVGQPVTPWVPTTAHPAPTQVPTAPEPAAPTWLGQPDPSPAGPVPVPLAEGVGTLAPTALPTLVAEVPTTAPVAPPTASGSGVPESPAPTAAALLPTEVPAGEHPLPTPAPEPPTAEDAAPEDDVPAVVLSTEEAARVIEEGWRLGWSQRETARRAQRAPSYVGRVYKQLDQQHPNRLHALPADEEDAS
ncbi:hypothetical protein ACFW1A_14775 [Kitasatospora sp. NPDC058965]|uniref:hypothetical protein n=1 Tax=Kitasatospora sp. NPDC058965 TaxID=3346682 RepID=UPI0036B4AD8C